MTITKKLNADSIYVITRDEGPEGRYFKAGELVKCVSGFESTDSASFKAIGKRKPGQADDHAWMTKVSNVTTYGETPVEHAGIVVGTEYEVIAKHAVSGSSYFSVGDVVVLERDDNTTQPKFRRVSDGMTSYVKLEAIGPVSVKKTLAETAGLVVGQQYEVTTDSSSISGTSCFKKGDNVTFQYDDKTAFPKFRRVADGVTEYVRLEAIGPVTVKTPAEIFGLKVGGKARIIRGTGTGNIVTMIEDDGTDAPEFNIGFLTLSRLELYVEPAATPVVQAGYKIGDKFRLKADDDRGFFVPGSIITLSRDDGSRVPEFTGTKHNDSTVTNYKGYAGLDEITPYTPTPLEVAGFKVGDKVEVISEYNFKVGDILIIMKDDGDAMPQVKLATGVGGNRYERITRFKAYVAPVTKMVRIVVDGSTVESKQLTQEQLDTVLAALPKPVVADVVTEDFQQPYLIDSANTSYHCFKEGDIVYVKKTYDHTTTAFGMSKNKAATQMDICGNVYTSEMTKLQAYKVVANSSHHGFKIGDVVFTASIPQRGANLPKPFYSVSKNPAAKVKDLSGEVYFTDVVAI